MKNKMEKTERREKALRYFDENRDFMNTVVSSEIEKNRKGDLKLEIRDENGAPIKNAHVRIAQKNHAFKHGANIFMLDELESEEKNEIYKKSFKEIFNLATVPFYWSDLEPEEGKPRFAADSAKIYRRPPIDLCLNYCFENSVEPKCHCLNYDNFNPDWVKELDVEKHKEKLEKRMAILSERYSSVIPSWEVTNETLDSYTRKKSKFYKENDFVEWSFKTADKYFPNNRLIINDYYIWEDRAYRENRSAYFMQIERLGFRGITHLDSVGMQFHSFFPKSDEEKMAATRYNPVHIYEILNKYAELGKKIQITEMTLPAYSDSSEDEAVQAELLENIYTLFFSHKAMEAIIYWNLVDGYAAWAPQGDMKVGENVYYGGLMRFDLSEKPAYKVLKDLFSKKWHTEEEGKSDENGLVSLRGFYGDYELETVFGGKVVKKTVSLSEDAENRYEIIV